MARPEGWHPEDIKAAIRKRGITLTDLARRNDLDPSTVIQACHRPLYAGERVIAEFLGVPATQIWPDRYDGQGQPRHPRIHLNPHYSGANGQRQRQKGAAA